MTGEYIHQFYYLWTVVLIVPLWLLIFLKNKKSRVEIIYMGILLGTSALGLDRYCSFYDYWRPPTLFKGFNFESFFYGFFWGGISTKFYEFTLKKEIIARANPNPVFVLIIVFSSFILYMGLLGMFGFNSVDIYVGLMLLWVIVLVLGKRWLLRISIVSGLMMTALNICWYAVILFIYPGAIEDIWLTKYLSAVTLFNVPIEEHFYIFSLGCFGSIMYKAVTGTKRN